MKCERIDLISYLDGMANAEQRAHIEGCKECRERAEEISRFLRGYAEAASLEEGLCRGWYAIDAQEMRPLPETILKKIVPLKKKGLAERVRGLLGKGRRNAEDFLNEVMSPQYKPLPASPKDLKITSKKKKEKRRNKNAKP